MFRLAMALFSMIATTVSGMGVIAALVAGYSTLTPILIAAGAGFLIAIPVTWMIAKGIYAS